MMIILHIVAGLAPGLKKAFHAIAHPVWPSQHPEDAVAELESDIREPEDALVQVLERAADDPAFIAQLTYQGSQALRGYNLTWEEKAALVSGDINWIETRIGKLDERLSTWPRCRLQQEIW